MILTVRAVVGMLAVIVATVIVQEVLVKVDCARIVFESSGGGCVVVVVLEEFGLVLWSS